MEFADADIDEMIRAQRAGRRHAGLQRCARTGEVAQVRVHVDESGQHPAPAEIDDPAPAESCAGPDETLSIRPLCTITVTSRCACGETPSMRLACSNTSFSLGGAATAE